MDYTYFVFTFFVFTLVVTAIFIAKKIKSPKDKNAAAVSEKEKKLFKLYQSLEDMIAGTMEFMEESKDEITQNQDKIAKMLEKAENILMQAKNEAETINVAKEDVTKAHLQQEPKNEFKKPILISNNLGRRDQVLLLKKEGQNVKQISKVLGMSQGEVKLIIGLDK